MQFQVFQKNLYQGIQIVQRAVAAKSTLPILKGIYLKAEADRGLQLIANDLEIGIEYWIKADIKKEGAMVIPAEHLISIVRELPAADINFRADLDRYELNLSCLNSNFTIKGYEAEEFPQLPGVDNAYSLSLSSAVLKRLIDEVKFSTSSDQTQPALTGGLLSISQQDLSLVATNTYRLAYSKYQLEDEAPEEINVILPGRTLNDLSHLLLNEGETEILISSNYVRFNFNDIVFISRLIEGQFPNYKLVIPKEYNTRIKVDRQEFYQAVKRVSLIAKLDSNVISLEAKGDEMYISSTDSDSGSASEKLEIETVGPEQKINIDVAYLLDVLKVLTEEVLVIELIGPVNPLTLKKEGEDDFIYLIMPVRPGA